jgi:hypothetical protein
MAPLLEGKSMGSDPKTALKGELLIWRTKNQARDKLYSPTQEFNFASNQSKLVPRKLDPGPSSKVCLSCGALWGNKKRLDALDCRWKDKP